MGDYVESLRKLIALGDRRLLPGHGKVVEDGTTRLSALLEHRLAREAEVLAALNLGPGTAGDLADMIYAGLPEALLRAARRNVLAHLIDLARRGVVAPDGALWEAAVFRRV